MTSQTPRRKFLASTVGGLTVALAGCANSSARTAPREGPDPFYIENHTNKEHKFAVSITHKRDGTEVVNGEYRVPANHGMEFSNVGELGETYRMEVAVDELGALTRDWSVSTCPTGERGADVNMAGAFFVREDKRGFVQNQCSDQNIGSNSELTYVAASEVAIRDD